jgi:hypothetical protein
VTGALLPSILTANYPAVTDEPAGACGPDWDLFVVGLYLDAGASSLDAVDSSNFPPTCALNAYADCAGGSTRSDGPPGVKPWTVEVGYARCTP